jgi:hypothetical protein
VKNWLRKTENAEFKKDRLAAETMDSWEEFQQGDYCPTPRKGKIGRFNCTGPGRNLVRGEVLQHHKYPGGVPGA